MSVDIANHTRRTVLALTAALAAGFAPELRAQTRPAIKVWKDPNCGCCTGWVEHLNRNGFTTTVIEAADMKTIKMQRRVPADLTSCHTAEVAGYTIEGHVPARAIMRLLAERHDALGLAVPGMPIGSPGMEGGKPEAYDVILFSARPPVSFGRFLGDQPV